MVYNHWLFCIGRDLTLKDKNIIQIINFCFSLHFYIDRVHSPMFFLLTNIYVTGFRILACIFKATTPRLINLSRHSLNVSRLGSNASHCRFVNFVTAALTLKLSQLKQTIYRPIRSKNFSFSNKTFLMLLMLNWVISCWFLCIICIK